MESKCEPVGQAKSSSRYKRFYFGGNGIRRISIFFNGVLSRTAVSLVLARDSAYGGILDEVGAFDIPPTEEMVLNPSASHSHFIDLDESFPSLSSELQKGALVVFWTAVIRTSDAGDAGIRFGGYLLIPSST